MKYKISLFILLAGLLLMTSACQEEPSSLVNPDVPETMPTNVSRSETGWDNPILHAEFEAIWTPNTNARHQMMEGTIDRYAGGEITFAVPLWGPEYEVRLKLKPNDVDPSSYEGPDNIIFRVGVPIINESGEGNASYEFFPDGIRFIDGIEVTICVPTWVENLSESNTYELVTIEEDWHDMQQHFVVTGRQTAMPAAVLNAAEGDTIWTRAERATEITYTLEHFSRWGVSSGTDDDPKSPDGILSSVEPLEGCWIMAPPPIEDPIKDLIKIY